MRATIYTVVITLAAMICDKGAQDRRGNLGATANEKEERRLSSRSPISRKGSHRRLVSAGFMSRVPLEHAAKHRELAEKYENRTTGATFQFYYVDPRAVFLPPNTRSVEYLVTCSKSRKKEISALRTKSSLPAPPLSIIVTREWPGEMSFVHVRIGTGREGGREEESEERTQQPT